MNKISNIPSDDCNIREAKFDDRKIANEVCYTDVQLAPNFARNFIEMDEG